MTTLGWLRGLENVRYLGYGVYIGTDPAVGEYVLYTSRADGVHRIHMTREEIDGLVAYADRG